MNLTDKQFRRAIRVLSEAYDPAAVKVTETETGAVICLREPDIEFGLVRVPFTVTARHAGAESALFTDSAQTVLFLAGVLDQAPAPRPEAYAAELDK